MGGLCVLSALDLVRPAVLIYGKTGGKKASLRLYLSKINMIVRTNGWFVWEKWDVWGEGAVWPRFGHSWQ